MKRSRETRFRDSVQELEERIGRAENFLETEQERMVGGRMKEGERREQEVYRDKNTLVEVTIHRRGAKSKSQTWDNNLTDSEAKPNYSRPTISSRATKASPGKRVRERPGVEGGNMFGATRGKQEKTVKELLEELREIVDASGVKDVHDFLADIEKSGTVKEVIPIKKVVAPPKSPQKTCRKPDHSNLEIKLQKLETDCSRYKGEVARYKQEHGVMQRQVEISRETSSGLETQLVDLKKIVSRLTRNNSELLGIVSEKINYEDQVAGLRQELASSQAEVVRERERVGQVERQLVEREEEVRRLRGLTAELRAGLQHGLAGLQVPRGRGEVGEVTRDILLGISALSENKGDQSSEADSAIDDPNSESLKSRPKSVHQADKLPFVGQPGQARVMSAPLVRGGNPLPPSSTVVQTLQVATERSFPPYYTVGGQSVKHPNSQGGHFAKPPNSEGGQFVKPPNSQGGQFVKPPTSQGGEFIKPANSQGGQFVPPTLTTAEKTVTSLCTMTGQTVPPSLATTGHSVPLVQTISRPNGPSSHTNTGQAVTASYPVTMSVNTTRSVFGQAPTGHNVQPPHTPPTKMSRGQPSSHQPHPALFPTLSLPLHPSLPPHLAPQLNSAPASLLPSTLHSPARPEDITRPRSSTLLEEERDVGHTFQPVPLNLSETMSTTETDGPGQVSQVTPPTVVENLAIQQTGLIVKDKAAAVKESLENKVQDFLFRLNQDSINLSLELPQPARPFDGPSLHLSLSTSDLGGMVGDETANTTLTEGKFLRGLETSIEVLAAENSTNSSS